MLFKQAVALLFLVLAAAAPVVSQEKEKLKVNQDGQLELTPEQEERMRRQHERLRDPSFIKLEIVPQSNCPAPGSKATCYEAHDRIEIILFMTNTSSEFISTSIDINSPHRGNDVQLFRDEVLVPYREGIAERIEKPPPFVSSIRVELEPGKKEMATVLYLDNWYGPLEPGRYRLDIKRRFLPDGGWTDKASAAFEVFPKNQLRTTSPE